MSKFVDSKHICPACGAVFNCHVAVSLNVTRSPAFREAILAEEFHVFACPACHARTVVDESFIYTDFERKHWIGVFPLATEPAWEIHERSAPEAFFSAMSGPDTPAIARKMAEGFKVRTVFGLAALREKLVAFDAGIDDASLAIFKLKMLQQVPGLLFHPAHRPVLREVRNGQMVFHVFPTENDGQLMDVPFTLFEQIKSDAVFNELREEFLKDSYVDAGRVMIEKQEGL